jgi:hypothetical protein
VPVRIRSADVPPPDRRAEHEREITELRLNMAAIVKIVFTGLAVLLSLGALLVAGGDKISHTNWLVKLIWHVCDWIDGPFSRTDGVFQADLNNANAEKLDAVVNWGIASVVYILVGNALQRILRPHRRIGR